MKKTILILLVLFFTSLTGSCQSKNQFKITGEIKGYGNGQIAFSHALPTGRIHDTVQIVNDKFIYMKDSPGPHMVFFRVLGNNVLDKPFVQGGFLIENTNMNFNASVNNINKYELLGSPTNDIRAAIFDNAGSVTSDFAKIKASYRKAVTSKEPAQVVEKLAQELAEKTEAYVNYMIGVPDYSNNHAVAYVIYNAFTSFSREQIKDMLSRFSDDFDNVYLNYMRERIENEESIYIGGKAPNFSLPDKDGVVYNLDSFKGKYLLLTFTASWCTWCKKETPFLKEAYELYTGKGLRVLTVNLDKTRELWLEDIEKFPVPWAVVSDSKAFNGPIVKKYAISAIPRIFLIDPSGKIIGMNLRGEKILEALSSAL